jgi:hypothetical protein
MFQVIATHKHLLSCPHEAKRTLKFKQKGPANIYILKSNFFKLEALILKYNTSGWSDLL